MKVLSSIAILLLMNSSFGFGGVDVGNGRVVEVNIERVFKGENGLLNYISKDTPLELSKELIKQGCTKGTIKEVKVIKALPLKGSLFVKNNFTGKVFYEFTDCKKDKK